MSSSGVSTASSSSAESGNVRHPNRDQKSRMPISTTWCCSSRSKSDSERACSTRNGTDKNKNKTKQTCERHHQPDDRRNEKDEGKCFSDARDLLNGDSESGVTKEREKKKVAKWKPSSVARDEGNVSGRPRFEREQTKKNIRKKKRVKGKGQKKNLIQW